MTDPDAARIAWVERQAGVYDDEDDALDPEDMDYDPHDALDDDIYY